MNKKTITRISSMLLLALMVVSMLFVVPFTASAAEPQGVEKTYDIAVVYDNSGSMYYDNTGQVQRWCRAKYSMEIFASMLDYSKDKLTIFPMWAVTTDGSMPPPNTAMAVKPVEIRSKNDIDKITNMYTVNASGTPFTPIDEAHEYLKNSNADEKWLIILSDGEFNMYKRSDGSASDINLPAELKSRGYIGKGIKVQYLGIDGAAIIDPIYEDKDKDFYVKNSTGAKLKDDLVDICNFMFQRSILPDNRIKGDKLTIDLSMRNLIVFVQGEDAEIISLTDSNGNVINPTMDSGQRKYSEVRAGRNDANHDLCQTAPIDYSLAGQVVTFPACSRGEYTLNYKGDRNKLQIFYEPDVDLEITILDGEGNEVAPTDTLYAIEYTVISKIVDRITGEDVTNHELLGNDVSLKTYVTIDGKTKEYDNGATFELLPDTQVDIVVEATYLGKYKITSKDSTKYSWLSNITVKEADFGLRIEPICEENWLVLKEHNKWPPIRVEIFLDGEPLTPAQVGATQFTIEVNNGLKYRLEALPNESAYNIYIAQDEDGNYIEPAMGKYEMKITGTLTDANGETFVSRTRTVDFKIKAYAWFWIPLIIILCVLALLGLFRPEACDR